MMQPHIRMFVLSHGYGPLIGLALALFLVLLGFPIDYRLIGFAALVCLFWLYPVALRRGLHYRMLSLASLQHLTLIVLYASHGYGGLASPFLLWLAMVPLLAFLYLTPSRRLWLAMTTALAFNVAAFVAWSRFVAAPPDVGPRVLAWLAGLSLLSASIYVAMMAVHLGRILSSRNEMELEAGRHRAEVSQLERRRTVLHHVGAAKAASLGRIGRECAAPVADILASCESVLVTEAAEYQSSGASDLQSIADASRHLNELVCLIDQHSRLDARFAQSQPDWFSVDLLCAEVGAITGACAMPAPDVAAEHGSTRVMLCKDRELLMMALVQLVRHAQNVVGDKGVALHSSRSDEGSVVIAVMIYSLPWRGPRATSSGPKSEGGRQPVHRLGVALAERISHMLGGVLTEDTAVPDQPFTLCFVEAG